MSAPVNKELTISPWGTRLFSFIFFANIQELPVFVKKKIQVIPVLIIDIHLSTLSGETMETLGEKIRKRRRAKGLSQKRLAELLGIQYQSVQDWERDRTKPSTGKIPELCEILDVTSTWLLSSGGAKYAGKVKMAARESPAIYGLRPEGRKFLELFERLKPDTQHIVIKLMEALLFKK